MLHRDLGSPHFLPNGEEEMPFLPKTWSQIDIQRFALAFMLANQEDVEELLEDEVEEDL